MYRKFDPLNPPFELTRVQRIFDRDLMVRHNMTGECYRGPIKGITTSGNTVSFDFYWLAIREKCQTVWKLSNLRVLDGYPIETLDSDNPNEKEIYITAGPGGCIAYITVMSPGDNLEKASCFTP